MPDSQPRVALFVTCLVDLFRPSVGFSAIELLEEAGCRIEVPEAQTCCGQPAYNSGEMDGARALARQMIAAFAGYDYVVAPSGSCAGMIRLHYPALFEDEPATREQALALAARTHELTSFLVDVMGWRDVTAKLDRVAAYHDSCSSLRELKVKAQPRALLGDVEGLDLAEISDPEACCGFGGTFCVKYDGISNAMAERKCADIAATGADLLVGGDLGCLMNMAGKLAREGSGIEVRHVAEVLAGMTDQPAIGDGEAG
jgi:L-lactate dehydrogenase complex protein LldE